MEQLIDLTELQQVLQDYAKDAEEMYKYQIALGGHNASRKLTDNVTAQVQVDDAVYEVTLKMQDYWKYIEDGSKGLISSPPGAKREVAYPPIDKLVAWINVKPILPRPAADGHIPSPRELAFLIHRKIRDYGREPFPAFATTQEEMWNLYKDKISQALGHDIEYYIRKVLPSNK